MYESIKDYYECKQTFEMTEAESLSFEEVDDMRAKIVKRGMESAEALMRNGQSPQRNLQDFALQDFANEQVKKLDDAIEKSQKVNIIK